MKTKRILKIIFISIYCALTVFLLGESFLNSTQSAKQSDAMSHLVDSIVNLFTPPAKEIEATELKINNKIDSAFIGDSYQIEIEFTPTKATHQSVSYSSSNTSLATVSKSGRITFLKEGTVIISTNSSYYQDLSDSMEITISEVPLQSFNLTCYNCPEPDDPFIAAVGYPFYLVPSFTPSNATDRVIDEYAVTAGTEYVEIERVPGLSLLKVTPLKPSFSEIITITATINALSSSYHFKTNYYEVKPIEEIIAADMQLNIEEVRPLEISFAPDTASFLDLDYEIADPTIISFSNYKITGLKEGTTTLTLKSRYYENITKAINVAVDDPYDLSSFISNQSNIQVSNSHPLIQEQLQLNLNSNLDASSIDVIYPDDATVNCTSSICYLSKQNEGKAVLSIKNNLLNQNEVYEYQFYQPLPTDVSLAIDNSNYQEAYALTYYQEYRLSIETEDDNSSYPIPAFEIHPKEAAEIINGANGLLLKPLSSGDFTLKLTYQTTYFNNTFSKSFSFKTSVVPIDRIDFISDSIDLSLKEVIVNRVYDLKAAFLPEDIPLKGFSLSTSNSGIIAVSQVGLISTRKIGEATITITSDDNPNVSSSITLKVKNIIKAPTVKADFIKNSDENTMSAGTSSKITCQFDADVTYRTVTYSSSNKDIATVSEDGIVTALKSGHTIITLTLDDGDATPIIINIELRVYREDIFGSITEFKRFIRKGAGHFLGFFTLGIFAGLTYMLIIKKRSLGACITYFAGIATASLSELIQTFIPTRSGLFQDVMLDFCGFFIASSIVILIFILIDLKKRKKQN